MGHFDCIDVLECISSAHVRDYIKTSKWKDLPLDRSKEIVIYINLSELEKNKYDDPLSFIGKLVAEKIAQDIHPTVTYFCGRVMSIKKLHRTNNNQFLSIKYNYALKNMTTGIHTGFDGMEYVSVKGTKFHFSDKKEADLFHAKLLLTDKE